MNVDFSCSGAVSENFFFLYHHAHYKSPGRWYKTIIKNHYRENQIKIYKTENICLKSYVALVLNNKQNIGIVLHFLVYKKNEFIVIVTEKISLEMIVFYVEGIQEIGWC